jgi:glycosidase
MPWELVEAQQEDPASPLARTRELIALRRRSTDLRTGGYETLPAPEGVWAWKRGEATAVAVNLSDEEHEVIGTRLEPWGAAILSQ